MSKTLSALLVLLAAGSSHAIHSSAQARPCEPDTEELPTALDSLTVTIGASSVKICYRRLVAGASGSASWNAIGDAVPVLHTDMLLDIGGVRVGSGSYELYITPQRGEWLLRVVRQPDPGFGGPAGSISDREVGRTYVSAEPSPTPTQTLNVVAQGSGNHAVLLLNWSAIEVAIPLIQR